MVTELYKDPHGFLDETMTFDRTRKPAYAVTLVALMNVVQAFAIATSADDIFLQIEGGLYLLGLVYFAQPYLLWFAVTGAVWILGKPLGAHARFGKLLKGIGWGLLPLIGTSVTWSIARYLTLSDSVAPEPVGTGIVAEMRALQEWMAVEATGDPVYLGLMVFGMLFVLPSAYLWTIAVDEASYLDTRRSAITVAVPAVAYLWWAISNVL